MLKPTLISLALICILNVAGLSQIGPVNVSGVAVDRAALVGGENLMLNGAGVRTRAAFKTYVAALYLGKNVTSTADALSLPGAKRLRIVMLRDMSSSDVGQSFTSALNANTTEEERAKIQSSTIQFTGAFNAVTVFKKGDVITLDWVPGTGLRTMLNNREVGGRIGGRCFSNRC
ncbi:MAG: chalcone isomerase family protein [Acidobacteriota bacterium]|nr:MAG: chalcone isomerase family protein [Acidobacteriota bacterium]